MLNISIVDIIHATFFLVDLKTSPGCQIEVLEAMQEPLAGADSSTLRAVKFRVHDSYLGCLVMRGA